MLTMAGQPVTLEEVRFTLAHLKSLRALRAAGHPVRLTNDPAWLLDMAIGRRAGWVEDPHAFGIVEPVKKGKLPRAATGDAQRHLAQLAHRVNTPRLRVYRSELGEWGPYLTRRLPDRFVNPGED
jgi:hypothetical protein